MLMTNKDEKYKSYKVSGSRLKSKQILVIMIHNDINENKHGNLNKCLSDVYFEFKSEEPGVFAVEVTLIKNVIYNSFSFRFDELLKMRFEEKENYLVDGVCVFNVNKLIDMINKKYVVKL